MNAVVGHSVAITDAASATSNLGRSTTSPPASSVPAANRIAAEWKRGEHTRCTSSLENSHTSRSSSTRAAAVPSSSTPLHTPLGRPDVPDV
jgi:hypothetical protein